jgi:hypothetical protein
MTTPQQATSPKIFISYAWENQATAKQLQQALQAAGAEIFVDYTGIQGGESLPTRISQALRWCDTLILLWSQHAKDSHWVELEWTSAIALKRHLIPCKLDETPLPEILWGKRYVEFKNFDYGFNELLSALRLKRPVKTFPESKIVLPVQPSILKLRSQPIMELTDKAVKDILKKHDFYCGEFSWSKDWCNPQGKGINHNYELQHDSKVALDHTTWLWWQQAGSPNYMSYVDAQEYIHELNSQRFAGYTDWRLPTLEEGMSLMEAKAYNDLYIDPVFDRTQKLIWTADLCPSLSPIQIAISAWIVGFYGGVCVRYNISNGKSYVRAVR